MLKGSLGTMVEENRQAVDDVMSDCCMMKHYHLQYYKRVKHSDKIKIYTMKKYMTRKKLVLGIGSMDLYMHSICYYFILALKNSLLFQ